MKLDNLRRWMGRTLAWCRPQERPLWQLVYVLPVLFFLLILSKLIGVNKDENEI